MKIHIPAKYINVLKLFVAKSIHRPALNCIRVDIGSTEIRGQASNGYIFGCFRFEENTASVAEPVQILIPSAVTKAVKATNFYELVYDCETKEIRLCADIGVSIQGFAVQEKYPDTSKLNINEVSGEASQYAAEHLSTLYQAAKLLHKDGNYFIAHNGLKPAPINFDDENFTGCIMPMKPSDTKPISKMADWFSKPVV